MTYFVVLGVYHWDAVQEAETGKSFEVVGDGGLPAPIAFMPIFPTRADAERFAAGEYEVTEIEGDGGRNVQ